MNLNTSAASDEELLRFFAYAREMRQLTGAPIDTMCQFDIPGMSWGIVQAAAQNGVRAILDFPNPSDRIGNIHTWRNRHFRWVAPDGKSKVLYLQIFPYNVAWKLGAFNMNPKPFVDVPGRDRFDFANSPLNGHAATCIPVRRSTTSSAVETANLEQAGSPYDIYPIAWSLSDNAMVDVRPAGLREEVEREIRLSRNSSSPAPPRSPTPSSSASARIIPEHRGDLTEYWTDGLGSDARRVGYNRIAKEDLVQAEMLWTMLRRNDAVSADGVLRCLALDSTRHRTHLGLHDARPAASPRRSRRPRLPTLKTPPSASQELLAKVRPAHRQIRRRHHRRAQHALVESHRPGHAARWQSRRALKERRRQACSHAAALHRRTGLSRRRMCLRWARGLITSDRSESIRQD